jgi:hypothetical protein
MPSAVCDSRYFGTSIECTQSVDSGIEAVTLLLQLLNDVVEICHARIVAFKKESRRPSDGWTAAHPPRFAWGANKAGRNCTANFTVHSSARCLSVMVFKKLEQQWKIDMSHSRTTACSRMRRADRKPSRMIVCVGRGNPDWIRHEIFAQSLNLLFEDSRVAILPVGISGTHTRNHVKKPLLQVGVLDSKMRHFGVFQLAIEFIDQCVEVSDHTFFYMSCR